MLHSFQSKVLFVVLHVLNFFGLLLTPISKACIVGYNDFDLFPKWEPILKNMQRAKFVLFSRTENQKKCKSIVHSLTCRRVCPPPFVTGGVAHSLVGEGGGGVPIPTSGRTLWYSRYICTLCPHPSIVSQLIVQCSQPHYNFGDF
jgi:hypothetical protein